MLRLMLFRHAKSDWPAGVADRERPLAPRGRKAAPVMGTYMVRSGLTPSQVLVSPARRTLETWAAACDSWASPPPTTYEEAIYEAAPEMLLDVIRRRGTDSPLMLVGHNPGLESLTARLVAAADRARLPVKFPTGGLAVIDLPAKGWAEVGPGTGTLERFVTPRSLEAEED
ncbi:phosphohistidine phosphatase [Ancylobacter sp. 3268]|uniref:SixA phosphatase family protein n=1 Tax=Ancylobacter sp. 3268 TaxID=2817752 RepID=UPI002862F0EB|nr:histidine phosphatase family protein [Ancylobacter sp. 3268]MDR6954389.1 phosphohistidine phosphatase [Ancylobacter sp. 3268]